MNVKRVPDVELEYDEDLVYYYEGEPFTGVAFSDDSTGRSEVQLVNGLQDGPARDWCENGALKVEENYRENVKHGQVKEYFPDGRLKVDAVYEYGVLMWSTEYDNEGNVIASHEVQPGSTEHQLYLRMKDTLKWSPAG